MTLFVAGEKARPSGLESMLPSLIAPAIPGIALTRILTQRLDLFANPGAPPARAFTTHNQGASHE